MICEHDIFCGSSKFQGRSGRSLQNVLTFMEKSFVVVVDAGGFCSFVLIYFHVSNATVHLKNFRGCSLVGLLVPGLTVLDIFLKFAFDRVPF